jgi:hypothetical protein
MAASTDRSVVLLIIYCGYALAVIFGGEAGWFRQGESFYRFAFLLSAATSCAVGVGIAWYLTPRSSERWQRYFLSFLETHRNSTTTTVLCLAVIGPLITAYFILDRLQLWR